MTVEYSKGLEGVIADETSISNVEGDIGRLSYRGYPIEQLVQQPFTRVVWLVLFGELATPEEEVRLQQYLQRNGALSASEIATLKSLPRELHSMRMLQSMIPLLDTRPVGPQELPFSNAEGYRGLSIVAKIPTLLATFRRLQVADEVPVYDAGKQYLANFLTMFHNKPASPEHVHCLARLQILQLEHSFNAGTFTCRVTASTLAPVESALSSAVGSLYGTLHGGADEAALNEAIKVGSPDKARAYVLDLLANKGRLMGMGHREYKKLDPRRHPQAHGRGAVQGHRFRERVPDAQGNREGIQRRDAEEGQGSLGQPGVLQGPGQPRHRHSRHLLHGWFRHGTQCRLAGTLPGVPHRQQDHAPQRAVHRAGHPLPVTTPGAA